MINQPNQTEVAMVPGVLFMGRRIFIESYGVLDKDNQRLVVALAQIMRERLLATRGPSDPLIVPVTKVPKGIGA